MNASPRTEHPSDTLVTLTCNRDLPLEERVELMAYAFAKMVQGSILREIVCWDISNGCIKFILGHVSIDRVPRGQILVKLEEVEEPRPVDVELKLIGGR